MKSFNRLLPLVVAAHLTLSVTAQAKELPERSIEFSGQKAMEHAAQMVALGPRPTGTPQGIACGDYIIGKLKALGLTVIEDKFQAETPLGTKNMRNIIAQIPGKKPEFIILGGHYDTKVFKEFRFVGANDGGSSAAVLLEMARVLASEKGEFSRWITFFDGEEAFVEWTPSDSLYGSRHVVRNLDRSGQLAALKAMILVDLVGGKTLKLKRESNSTSWLVNLIWEKASSMGHSSVFVSDSVAVEDDHMPFLRVGVPAVDLVDLDYTDWHRDSDTLDKLSPRSMEIVGRVVLRALPEIESRLAGAPKP